MISELSMLTHFLCEIILISNIEMEMSFMDS